MLKVVFNSVIGYSEDADAEQALNLSVEIVEICPVLDRSALTGEGGAIMRVSRWAASLGPRCRVRVL